MKIIIAGDGKVGLALTRQLLHEGHEVTIVDSNPVVLQANMYPVSYTHLNKAAYGGIGINRSSHDKRGGYKTCLC